MKRSILTFAIILASSTGLFAQRTASASMQISATVVESARLNVSLTESGAEVTSSSLGGVVFTIAQKPTQETTS